MSQAINLLNGGVGSGTTLPVNGAGSDTPTAGSRLLLAVVTQKAGGSGDLLSSIEGSGAYNGLVWGDPVETILSESNDPRRLALYQSVTPGSPSPGVVQLNFAVAQTNILAYTFECTDAATPVVLQSDTNTAVASQLSVSLPGGLTAGSATIGWFIKDGNIVFTEGTGFTRLAAYFSELLSGTLFYSLAHIHPVVCDSNNGTYSFTGIVFEVGQPGAPAGPVPDAPTLAVVATSWDAVKLTAAKAVGGATTNNIKIYRHTSSPVTQAHTLVATLTPDGIEFDTGRAAETQYYYKAWATGDEGDSAPSSQLSATTFNNDAIQGWEDAEPITFPLIVSNGEQLATVEGFIGKVIRAVAGASLQVDMNVLVKNSSNVEVGNEDFEDIGNIEDGEAFSVPLSPDPVGPQTVSITFTPTIAGGGTIAADVAAVLWELTGTTSIGSPGPGPAPAKVFSVNEPVLSIFAGASMVSRVYVGSNLVFDFIP